MSLLNPWVILSLLLALFGVYEYGHHNGYEQKTEEVAIEVAKLNDKAREKEHVLTNTLNDTATKLIQVQNDADKKITKLTADVRSGAVRLSIPVQTHCAVQPSGDTTTTSERGAETRADLDGGTAETLISIAKRGDDAIRQLNACIDSYNQARETVNSK